MNNSPWSNVRPAGREHFPQYPKGFIAVRILQLIFAVIVLGLSAFGVWYLAFDGDEFILAVACMTLITSIYHLVAEYGAPSIYNYWAVLGLDILLVVMWLCSFALLASQVAGFFALGSGYCTYYACYYGLSDSDYIVASCLAAAAGLGGVEFVLHLVSLVIHGVMLHRHRAAGLHCVPVVAGGGGAAAATTVMNNNEKTQATTAYYQQVPQNIQPPAPSYQQTGYAPQQIGTPPPQQMPYAPPQQQQQQPQGMVSPQPYYPQASPSPLVSQPTGGSYVHQQVPQQQQQYQQ
ncbi:hypothetical protein QBC46DRAFT_372062 [Diplogelasinospora grovesii]|uniref:MARVEL domain-containing protein n=1 Tax=Diplogelasinospora grovesii TaxID=303347 RepID=A0AAN6NIG8_9PEZI|nr:hypothetical protein QBC46DRAFT_372062 [Diplogelasinospora grovesii]